MVGTSGKDLVTRYIDNIVPYYIEQSKANNHAVREAACACMAEVIEGGDGSEIRQSFTC